MAFKPSAGKRSSKKSTAAKRPLLKDRLKAELPSPHELIESDRDSRRERASQKNIGVRYDAALEKIESLENQVKILSGLSDSRKVAKWNRVRHVKSGEATAIALLSDWHVEEEVFPNKVGNKNKYNLEIADQSIRTTFDKILLLLEDARNLANVRNLLVWLGGDFISGFIHDELAESNLLAPLAACRFAEERIASGLKMLLDNAGCDSVTVVTSNGNHGRTTPKRRTKTYADNSFEYNMYLHLRNRMQNDKLHWQVGEGYHNYIDVHDYTCRFHHGDSIRYQGGVGGLTIPANKKIAQWNKATKAHYDFFGHYHQFGFTQGWVSNGSMIGYSEFAVEIGGEYEPPKQVFCVLDRKYGLTRVLPIFCRDEYRKAKR